MAAGNGNTGNLVLTRKRGESVVIGGNVWLTVLDIKGDTVKLGIEAPKSVPVDRREVHEAKLREAKS